MDIDSLVEAVTARVKQKLYLEEMTDKKKLLIISQEHGTDCHSFLDCNTCSCGYMADWALLKEYQVQMEQYDVVLLYQLTNEMLGKITAGIGDTPYAKLAIEAILLGKKIYVPNEEVELYQYENTAPKVYYQMMYEKINLLRACGVIFCGQKDLEKRLCQADTCCERAERKEEQQENEKEGSQSECQFVQNTCTKETFCFSKKIITEKDMIDAYQNGANEVEIQKHAILSELAKEYAHEKNINITRLLS